MHPAPPLPTGTVTFLFTDIEGSAELWERQTEEMQAALARHDAVLHHAIDGHGGHVFKTIGDEFCAAFGTAPAALAAALEAQRALTGGTRREEDPSMPLRVRMALHTGGAEERDGDYFGPALNRVARLLALAHGGQSLISQAAFELIRDALPMQVSLRDLGSHCLKDLQRPEQVFQLLHPELPDDFPPLKSLDTFPHNLPLQLNRFIGREQEMADVKRRLATTRLLTLTGAGGCGKTRLALQIAADVLEEYDNGVWLVEFAGLADPTLVPQQVAAALRVKEQPGRPLSATLMDYLRTRKLLLVWDNCEHLVEACASLADVLLRGCPDLRILATGREALSITGEMMWRVPSLPSPDCHERPSAERLTQYDAVRLFIERAIAVQPAFAVTNQNAPAVAHICHQVDGIPLAIELAAARVMLLSVEQIAARLNDRLRLLTGGSRTAPPRQQTLRAAIDWSYELLAEAERTLLRRLSVFAGGFTLEAAERVCAGARVEERDVLELLGQLVDKSLVVREEQAGKGEPWPGREADRAGAAPLGPVPGWYRLLETIRQYGAEKLGRAGEAADVRKRHLDWYLELAEQAEPELRGPEQLHWLERLDRERDNLRAALDWAEEAGEAETGLRLAGALRWYWTGRSYRADVRKRLARLLALAPGARHGDPGDITTPPESAPADHASFPELGAATAGRAKALRTAALLAAIETEYGEARTLYEESGAIYRRLGDQRGFASSLDGLALAARYQGDRETARRLAEESLALWEEVGDQWGIAEELSSLAGVADAQGDYPGARALYERSLAAHRELGDQQGIAFVLNSLGQVLQRQGDLEAARALHEQSLAVWSELAAKGGVVWALKNLGNIARYRGDLEAARSRYEECLVMENDLGDQLAVSWTQFCLGRIALEQRDLETAERLLGHCLTTFREFGDRQGMAHSHLNLGLLAVLQSDYTAARDHHEMALLLLREWGDQWALVLSLEAFAALAAAQDQQERGARLFGAADALREAIGSPRLPAERADYEQKVASLRDAIGEELFATAWAEGRAMSLDHAIEEALAGRRS